MSEDLRAIYRRRFEPEQAARHEVWRVLIDSWFARYLEGVDTVLDLGAGWGHFVNQVDVPTRYAIDLNPDAPNRLAPGVVLVGTDATTPWQVDAGSLDLVFTSNFLEHLPSRDAVAEVLGHARRSLRPGGRIVCLGPNVRYMPGSYWDFFDHQVPLTDRSLAEVLEIGGFRVDERIGRFLPATMAGRRVPPSVLIRAYLRVPPVWRLVGRQFLVTATRST